MDFFEHQDDARRKTGRMVLLFLLAVVFIVLALNAVFAGLYLYTMGEMSRGISSVPLSTRIDTVPPELFWAVTGITLLIILGGSTFKILQLNDGGETVADMVGARKVNRSTTDGLEKRLLNVVDEMAIASGVTVPQVYIMDSEPGINAFAAGYKPNEAVVAVTRGSLEQLDREELQGVVAHEFSHILNGDMRINIRLMGVLHGILIIGMVGGYMLRSMAFSGRRHRSRSRHNKNGGAIIVIGLVLMAIGYAGVFFGRLIKAGISRQREFLADASAVQFTRNHQGITDALKKIGRIDAGSMIENEHAEEMSHMFFGESVSLSLSNMMATHPPLIERIKRINKGRLPLSSPEKRRKIQEKTQAAAARQAQVPVAGGAGSIVNSIGNPGELHMLYAAALLASIPEPVTDTLAVRQGAMALMFALILDKEDKTRQKELQVLSATPHAYLGAEVERLFQHIDALHARYRLPLFDMAVPVLKDLSQEECDSLIGSVKQVIDSDRRIKLDELTMYVLLKSHLRPGAAQADKTRIKTLSAIQHDVEWLLTLLAYLGRSDQYAAQQVFDAAADGLATVLSGLVMQDIRGFRPAAYMRALERFASLSPGLKSRLLQACLHAVMLDGQASIKELEVIRGICAAIDVPVPPILSADVPSAA